jgi:hypothetical protein
MPMYVWHCDQCSKLTEIFNSIHESDSKPERCSNDDCPSNSSTISSTTSESTGVVSAIQIKWTKQLQPQINRWRYCD